MTRGDLSHGAQLAQSVHAAFAFAEKYPDITKQWMTESNYLVILLEPTYEDLFDLAVMASGAVSWQREHKSAYATFSEPNLCNELTAVAIWPSRAMLKVLSRLPLAGREGVR